MSKKELVYRKEGLKLTKPDEIVAEQREDIHELREELWLYKKALKLACEELCKDGKGVVVWKIEDFIAQAKEMMRSE